MKNYGYEAFMQEEFYPKLLNFFGKLFEKKDGSVILFVSRKAYCLFLLMKKKGLVSAAEGLTIFSDRFIMKNTDEKLFEGKTVYLVDDTVSTGKHIRDICEMLGERTSYKKIILCIFMQEENFDEKESIEKDYHATFYNECVKPRNEVLYFCAAETYVIHEAGIPYIVELPVFGEAGKENIKLTWKEFEKLKSGNQEWIYYDCSQAGIEQSDITDGVMILRNHFFKKQMKEFIFEFTIKIQSTRHKDGVELAIVPFAILKSISFDKLWKLFLSMYENTNYGRRFIEFKNESASQGKFEEKVYVAVYRAVVYNLSMYIGIIFKEYFERIFQDKKLTVYEENQKYNFRQDFLEATDELFGKSYQSYLLNLMDQVIQEKIEPVGQTLCDVGKYEMLTCSYEAIYLYILAIINEVKNKNTDIMKEGEKPQAGRHQWEKFITIEKLLEVVYKQYPEEKKEKLDILATRCFIALLGQSKLANELYYQDGKILRGFKYGENSGTTLTLAEKIFYVAVSTYYSQCADDNEYTKNYEKFLVYLKMFLMNYQLFGVVVSKDEFYIYSKIFQNDNVQKNGELKNFIEERKFLASDEPYYIKNLREFIETAEIYQ